MSDSKPDEGKVIGTHWTREQTYLVAVIVLIELIFLHTVYTYGEDVNVVNLWSFAGTITSIILAVLAIIYSWVETGKQRSSGELLAIQIDSLGKVVADVQESKGQLKAELHQISQVTTRLGEISAGVSDQKSTLEAVAKQVTDIANKQTVPHIATPSTGDVSQPTTQSPALTTVQFHNLLARMPFGATATLYAITFLGPLGVSEDDMVKKHLAVAVTPPVDSLTPQLALFREGLWTGLLQGIAQSFAGLKALAANKAAPTLREDLQPIAEAFFEDTADYFSGVTQQDFVRLIALVQATKALVQKN